MKDNLENTLKNLKAPAPDPEARLRASARRSRRFARANAAAANEGQVRESAGLRQVFWRRLRLSP